MQRDVSYFLKILKLFSYFGMTPLYIDSGHCLHNLVATAYPIGLLVFALLAMYLSIKVGLMLIEPGVLNVINLTLRFGIDGMFFVSCFLITISRRHSWKTFLMLMYKLDRKTDGMEVRTGVWIFSRILIGNGLFLITFTTWLWISTYHLKFWFVAVSFYAHIMHIIFRYIVIDMVTKRYQYFCGKIISLSSEPDWYIIKHQLVIISKSYGLLHDVVNELDQLFGWPTLLFHARNIVVALYSISFVFMYRLELQDVDLDRALVTVQNLAIVMSMLVRTIER